MRGERRIGIYGGTFDPIHIGHLALALELKERAELDEVWICPAACSPHKREQKRSTGKDRLSMVQLAVEEIPGLVAREDELLRPAPSYTVDTVRAFRKAYPHYAFFLLLGSDSLDRLAEWHEVEKLLELAPLRVGRRCETGEPPVGLPAPLERAVRNGWFDTPLLQVSASRIRERCAKGLYCGHLVPDPVHRYIQAQKLYS